MDGFTQRRMRVNGGLDFFMRDFQRQSQRQLGDHFRGLRADDVRAQQFAIRFAKKEFDEAVHITDGPSPRRRK